MGGGGGGVEEFVARKREMAKFEDAKENRWLFLGIPCHIAPVNFYNYIILGRSNFERKHEQI